jgi:tetratricopeptide (TPR) repeat protein
MGKLSQAVGALSDADRLRELIAECEKILARIDANNVRQLLQTAETAHQLVDQITAPDADIRGEVARLVAVDERILRYSSQIVKLLGGREVLVQYRSQIARQPYERFWMLDLELDHARKKLMERLGIFAAIVVVVLIVGYLARGILFPPDPAGDAIALATRALQQNDALGAIQAITTGLTIVPTNTELLVWQGILLEQQGDSVKAQKSYDDAQAILQSDKDFYLTRALTFVRLGDYYRAITDTNVIIEHYPDYADAYYVRASGYEGIHANTEAMADLQKCGDLAQAEGKETLYAEARVRLATLMQAMR